MKEKIDCKIINTEKDITTNLSDFLHYFNLKYIIIIYYKLLNYIISHNIF